MTRGEALKDFFRKTILPAALAALLYCISSFFINNPMVVVFGVFQIAVWWDITCMRIAGRTSGFQYSFNFLTCVPDKPLIHDIQKRGKLTGFLTVTVNTIIDCYKSNFLFSKQNVSEKTYLQMISANSGHILADTGSDFSVFNTFNKSVP